MAPALPDGSIRPNTAHEGNDGINGSPRAGADADGQHFVGQALFLDAQRLFKRDFAGEILDRHADLQLVDYGFAYRRNPQFPQDDITWFLMEKR